MLSPLERRALASLPPSILRWEIGFVRFSQSSASRPAELPYRVRDTDLDGVLLVLEEGTGLVRTVGPLVSGDALWPVLRRAFHDPAPPTVPSRPRAIRCDDAALSARLRAEIDGAHVVVEEVEVLPAVQDALGSLTGRLAPAAVHGIEGELPRWASTLSELCEVAPWHWLPENHLFRFECPAVPELEAAVAVVMGIAGAQEGVVLYASEEAYERFSTLADAGEADEALAEAHASCLYLTDAAELDGDEQAAVRSDGLLLPGGRVPYVVASEHQALRPMLPREQRVLLAAIEAIVALCASHDDYDERPCQDVVDTVLGPVLVRSEPPSNVDTPMAHAFTHTILLTEVHHQHDDQPSEPVPAVVVKLAKRDALTLAKQVEDADQLHIEPQHPAGVRIRMWAGSEHLGALCDVPERSPSVDQLLDAPTVLVMICAGGARRTRVRQEDVVLSLRLSNRAPEEERRHDVLFDMEPAFWPDVVDTLKLYAEGVFGSLAAVAPEQVLQVLKVSSTVWNGVVLADYAGDGGVLDQIRGAVAGEAHRPTSVTPIGIVDRLVRHKRQHYPGDPRIIGDVHLEWKGREPHFVASATLPVGYSLDGTPN